MKDANQESDYTFVIRRRTDLDEERQSYLTDWRDIADYILPRSARFLVTDNKTRGHKNTQKIVDFTASRALRDANSGFMANITNPARPWFKLTYMVPSMSHAADVWLDDSTAVLNDVFIRSNVYTELSKLYNSYLLYGTGAMIILEDDETVLRCETFSIGTYWLATNSKRKVDEFLRSTVMTVRQIVNEFGIDNVSVATKTCYENKNFDQKIEVLHWIGPNSMYDRSRIESKYKKYRELYVEAGGVGSMMSSRYTQSSGGYSDKTLRVSGYDEFPVVAPRWDADGEDTYGKDSPGALALPLVKRLQQEVRAKARALEKQVDPPLNVPESARRNTQTGDPRGINYTDMRTGNDHIKPLYQVTFDTAAVTQDIVMLQKEIDETFYKHLFMMISQERRSGTKAREIEELHDEKMNALGPILERLNDELLDPLVNRGFSIAARRGLMPPPPPEIQGLDLKVDYVSPMAQAQKMVGIAGQDRFRNMVAAAAQIDPSALDLLNVDEDVREYAKRVGVSAKLVNSQETVEERRKARAEEQAQRQQMAQQQAQADITKTLATAPTDKDNALTQLMNIQRGVPG